MKVESFVNVLGVEFYTGVPDSQLKALCDYLMDQKGIGKQHIIAANETVRHLLLGIIWQRVRFRQCIYKIVGLVILLIRWHRS